MENTKKHSAENPEQIDNLFRNTLEGQRVEPGKSIWRGINRKLLVRELIHFNFSNLSGTYLIGGIAGIILIPALLYLTLTPGKNIPSQPNTETRTSQNIPLTGAISPPRTKANSTPATPSSGTSGALTQITQAASTQPSNEKNLPEINQTASTTIQKVQNQGDSRQKSVPVSSVQKKTTIHPNLNQKSKPPADIAAVTTAGSPPQSGFKSNAASDPYIEPMQSNTSLSLIERDTNKHPGPNMVDLGIFPSSYVERKVLPQYFSAGLQFMPELTFYQTSSSYSKVNYWLGADVAYHLWKFYFRPGVRIGYMYDDGAYQVNYKSKDSIGYYYEVVSYTIDPHGVIIYNTVTHTVYDSIIHNSTDPSSNRYQFIQIPLILGFDVLELKKFGLSVQAGPVVSWCLAEKEISSQNTDLTGARLLERTPTSTPDKSANWQIWAAIHMDYRIGSNFDVFLEPTYKYYFNPVSGSDLVTARAPWGIGLGIGVKYNFGYNTQNP
jgi:hypothetical protein